MRPIFTIHAGEYLVGSFIEQKFKNCNVWIPSKDTGVDLLITNKNNTKTVSLQIKFSKDFLKTHFNEFFQTKLLSSGWWTINKEKLTKSEADYWVFVLCGLDSSQMQCIVIKPAELLKRLTELNRKSKTIQTYFCVSRKHKCWESRGLENKNRVLIAENKYVDSKRDFSEYLNNWEQIEIRLK